MYLILWLSVCCLFTSCLAQTSIDQSPPLIVSKANVDAELHCTQVTTSHDYMYWYHQAAGRELKFIAYSFKGQEPTYDDSYKDKLVYMMEGKGEKQTSLKIKSLTAQNQGVYYCASSAAQGAGAKLEFGGGTFLSILENGKIQRSPEVKIFPPNKREFKDHNLISLVCVASGFYPEHVQLNWFINGVPRNGLYQNVASKKENDNSFSTSKRLSLTRSEYFNPENKFKCEAGFIGNGSVVFDEVWGEQDCGVSKESYAMYINQGKISYIMVLFKSGLYALIVLAIIWRRKVLSGSW